MFRLPMISMRTFFFENAVLNVKTTAPYIKPYILICDGGFSSAFYGPSLGYTAAIPKVGR